DDLLSLLEPVGYHDVAALLGTGRYAALLDFLGRVDHEHIAAGLIEQDGGLRNRQPRFRRAPLHGDADNPAGDEKAIGIRHRCPHRHGVRRRVDLHVQEVTHGGMRVDGAVGQLDANVDMRVLPGVFGAAPVVVEQIALADLEGDVDGVLADDRCKLSRGGLDQVALGENLESDPTVDWGADLGVAEIDLRLVERRLCLHHARLRRRLVGLALVDRRLRDVLVTHQLPTAVELQLAVDLRRLGLREGGAGLLDGRLVGRLLDQEQQVALLDVLSLFEFALLEKARHAGDDIDLIDRGEASDVIDGFGHLPAHHWRDRNRGRRRGALGGGDAAGGRKAQHANGGFPSNGGTTGHRGSPDYGLYAYDTPIFSNGGPGAMPRPRLCPKYGHVAPSPGRKRCSRRGPHKR